MTQNNLVYGVAGADLAFLEVGLAGELASLRAGYETWEQARAGIATAQWGRILERLKACELPVPGDGESFDLDYIPGYVDGDWPEWPVRLMLEWMPREIIDAYGTREGSVFNGEFVSIDPSREAEVVAALRTAGWDAVKDEVLVRRACGFAVEV